jgi:hypothetical protein
VNVLKNLCGLCGTEIKFGLEFCSECERVKGEIKKSTDSILRSADAVASDLRLRGIEMKDRIRDFEGKLVNDFLSTGEKLLSEHFNKLEHGRKGVK